MPASLFTVAANKSHVALPPKNVATDHFHHSALANGTPCFWSLVTANSGTSSACTPTKIPNARFCTVAAMRSTVASEDADADADADGEGADDVKDDTAVASGVRMYSWMGDPGAMKLRREEARMMRAHTALMARWRRTRGKAVTLTG